MPELQIVTPLATDKTRNDFELACNKFAPELKIKLISNNTAQVLASADVVLVASGTATFEALLCKRPMVVGYRLNPLTYAIIQKLGMLKIEHVSMANLLSGEALAPEFIQQTCEKEQLLPAVMRFFDDQQLVTRIQQHYENIHASLMMDTDKIAADAVLQLWKSRYA
jgi:lipid-A-disaccharide synthase